MRLYYDHWHDLWYQRESEERISFGKNKVPLPTFNDGKDLFSFDLNLVNSSVGPLIGIMASLSKNGAVLGNIPLFKTLQQEAMKNGGVSVVFAPEEIKNERLSGFIFIPKTESWYPVITPLPDVVYNRVPLRKTEESTAFIQATSLFEEWKIPFFNPSFIDKSTLYELGSNHPFLKPLMPETIVVNEEDLLKDFFEKHQGVYLKPTLSSRGKGIFLIRSKDGEVEFRSHNQQTIYPSFDHFWKEKNAQLLKRRYIAQMEIIPAKLDGHRFDFRIHAHDSLDGYKITGIGVRQSQKQNITTHVPNGGVLLPYERVQTKEHDQFFQELVKNVGHMLTKELGYFGEFSIDAGLTESGKYILYEVNSKPMTFDEKKIEKERIRQMVALLFRKANYK
ncbi:YheC/YheD family protein [Mesobacillus maritimus]|uniref:YheC/YheD family protein n=1 Tax=Mesobacillus maritimus TaxID=1643336 RepID=A0ABS7JZ18_9BACI|nr:YheC/YheD family protein [Mesobacillus maritimus]MBY0095233.1 YheC/YheD family protein [Mesobacillus maritimus]